MLMAPLLAVVLKLNVALRPSLVSLALEKASLYRHRHLSHCSALLGPNPNPDTGGGSLKPLACRWSAMPCAPSVALQCIPPTTTPRHMLPQPTLPLARCSACLGDLDSGDELAKRPEPKPQP